MAVAVTTRRGEAAVGAGLVLVAAYVVWEGARMPAGTVALPGPGFFPVALGALLGAVGAGLVLGARRGAGRDAEPVVLGHRNVAAALLALGAVGLLLERLGFLLTIGLFLLVLLRVTSGLGWLRAAAFAAAMTGAAYVVFDVVLGVRLPAGVL